MNTLTTLTAVPTRALKLEAMSNISVSFELFCLASGMEALGEMMDHDAQAPPPPPATPLSEVDARIQALAQQEGRVGQDCPLPSASTCSSSACARSCR